MTPMQGWAGAARKTVTRRPSLSWAGLLFVACVAAGCADRFDGYTPVPGAVQHPHPDGVAQPARGGGILQAFDPDRSVLPLALGGVLVDYRAGVRFGFRDAYDAGFNAVLPEPEQPMAAIRAAAEGSRVLVLTGDDNDEGFPQRLEADGAILVAVNRPADLDRLPAAIRTAPRQPVWALLRAHADRGAGEALPLPGEAALLASGALAAGATGLVWQGEDNYAARNAGQLGIAAAPPLDYGIRTDPDSGRQPYRATPDDIAASRRLWDAVAQLNRRIERLAPMLLRADAADGWDIAVAMGEDGGGLRGLLKPWDGAGDPRRLLLLVNAGDAPVGVRIGFARPLASIERWQEAADAPPPDADLARGLFRDRIAAQGVRLYRITLR